jgi:hypothetical protein
MDQRMKNLVVSHSPEDDEFARWVAMSGPERLATVSAVLREALRRKRQVLAGYRDALIAFCPHVLGDRGDGPCVLAFVVLAEPALVAEGWRSPKRWRWMRVSDLGWAMLRRGPWWSPPGHTRPSLDGLTVELEAS